jgi:hypothetical protein
MPPLEQRIQLPNYPPHCTVTNTMMPLMSVCMLSRVYVFAVCISDGPITLSFISNQHILKLFFSKFQSKFQLHSLHFQVTYVLKLFQIPIAESAVGSH